jgi:molybdopterin-binding protein
MTSIITADAARELRLKKGQIVAAVIKSTQVDGHPTGLARFV